MSYEQISTPTTALSYKRYCFRFTVIHCTHFANHSSIQQFTRKLFPRQMRRIGVGVTEKNATVLWMNTANCTNACRMHFWNSSNLIVFYDLFHEFLCVCISWFLFLLFSLYCFHPALPWCAKLISVEQWHGKSFGWHVNEIVIVASITWKFNELFPDNDQANSLFETMRPFYFFLGFSSFGADPNFHSDENNIHTHTSYGHIKKTTREEQFNTQFTLWLPSPKSFISPNKSCQRRQFCARPYRMCLPKKHFDNTDAVRSIGKKNYQS